MLLLFLAIIVIKDTSRPRRKVIHSRQRRRDTHRHTSKKLEVNPPTPIRTLNPVNTDQPAPVAPSETPDANNTQQPASAVSSVAPVVDVA